LVTRYDLYLTCCPYCRHDRLIRWGYYQRQGKPLLDAIRIQRIRCQKCGRTSAILPSFLLAYRSFAVAAAQQLLMTYINHPDDWQQALKLMIELSTAYHWLRRLRQQANRSLADIRTALLNLKPDYPLTKHINGKPVSLTSNRELLTRFVTLAQQLFQAAVRLNGNKLPEFTDSCCFLNYFLATQTGKALLQR
jgi:transposase-like protein